MWKKYIKFGLKIATPIILAGVAANPQSAEIIWNFLKSLTGGNNLGPTDMHGQGLIEIEIKVK